MFNMLTSSKGNFRVSLQNRHYFFSLILSDSFGLKMIRARRAIGSRYVGEEERKEGRKGGRVTHLLRARIGEHDLWLERRMAWLFYSTLEEERSSRFLRVRQNRFYLHSPKKKQCKCGLSFTCLNSIYFFTVSRLYQFIGESHGKIPKENECEENYHSYLTGTFTKWISLVNLSSIKPCLSCTISHFLPYVMSPLPGSWRAGCKRFEAMRANTRIKKLLLPCLYRLTRVQCVACAFELTKTNVALLSH